VAVVIGWKVMALLVVLEEVFPAGTCTPIRIPSSA
jgi:hypothetical protein